MTLSLRTWHCRLGHLNEGDIRILAKNAATKIKLDTSSNSEPLCIPCLQGKQHLVINRNPSERATLLGTLIYSDICGPIETPSHSSYKYFIIYVDDWRHYIWVYFMNTKTADEISSRFRGFLALLQTQCPTARIQQFRSDNGTGEYNNSIFQQIL